MFIKQLGLLPLLAVVGLAVSCVGKRKLLEQEDNGSIIFNVEGVEKLDPQTQQFHVEVVRLETVDSLVGQVERTSDFEIQGEIVMTDINLGPKEFKLSVIAKDASGKAFYSGSGKHVVEPGTQKLSQPIALKKVEFAGQLISVQAKLSLTLGSGSTTTTPKEIVLSDAAKAVLAKGKCASCHNPDNEDNEKIYLDKFPFTSDKKGLTSLEKVVEAVAKAIDPALDPKDDVEDMPKGDATLDATDIATFTTWYKSLSAPVTTTPVGDISALPIDLVEITWKAEKYDFLVGKAALTQVSPGIFEGPVANVPAGENILATVTVSNGGQAYAKDLPLALSKVEQGKALDYQAQIAKPQTSVSIDVVIE
ncbi:MAG: hypothetical protein AB7T49_10335 [Oligoflexales bacterium]